MSLSLSGDIQPAEPAGAAPPPPVAELRQTLLRSHTSPSPLFSFDLHPPPPFAFPKQTTTTINRWWCGGETRRERKTERKRPRREREDRRWWR
ncbi:hypothetical protein HanXRQr2_Chr13g0572691 [Helianthus annuus]|uniref:Uncharacterized protein n=1 Tax=Helianthus annuus TaxID=4232 RepID=A0A251SPX2_HELAN|nr:hypothetical protein HanXRQr2_Chr13g0572691 [Helianthus annuus]KAJ0496561.1 hypothetical protein HanHA89_Chr13g0501181 [Helianthus annuus]